MKAAGRFPDCPVQRSGYGVARLAWAIVTIIALAASECWPITAALPPHRADLRPAVAGEPLPGLAMISARWLANSALARLLLRFEACGEGQAGRFLARASATRISLTATEAVMIERATAGAGRLGRGADLGLPRNAGSLDANEQLPGPRRD